MSSNKVSTMAPATYYASAVYFGTVGVVAIVINVSSIIVYIKDKKLRTPFNNLLMNVVFMELISTFWGIPINFVSSLTFGEFMKNDVLCLTTGMGLAISGMCSVCTLTILGVHRFFVITFPHRSEIVNSPMACKSALLGSWIFTIVTACPPIIGWGSYERDAWGVSCGPDWIKPSNLSYSIYLVILGFIFPVSILAISSSVIIANLYKRSRQIGRLTLPLNTMSPQSRNRERRENRLTKMVLAMVGAFVLIWSPYAIAVLVTIIKTYQTDEPQSEIYEINSTESIISTLPVFLVKMSTFINPIIYICCNSQFRSSLEELWCNKCFHSNNTTTNEALVVNQAARIILKTDQNELNNV